MACSESSYWPAETEVVRSCSKPASWRLAGPARGPGQTPTGADLPEHPAAITPAVAASITRTHHLEPCGDHSISQRIISIWPQRSAHRRRSVRFGNLSVREFSRTERVDLARYDQRAAERLLIRFDDLRSPARNNRMAGPCFISSHQHLCEESAATQYRLPLWLHTGCPPFCSGWRDTSSSFPAGMRAAGAPLRARPRDRLE